MKVHFNNRWYVHAPWPFNLKVTWRSFSMFIWVLWNWFNYLIRSFTSLFLEDTVEPEDVERFVIFFTAVPEVNVNAYAGIALHTMLKWMLLVILYCASPSWYILQFNYFVLINVLGDSILCRSIFVLAIYSVNLQRADRGLFGRKFYHMRLRPGLPFILLGNLERFNTTWSSHTYRVRILMQ